jgi:uncharacterized membrane protein YccC
MDAITTISRLKQRVTTMRQIAGRIFQDFRSWPEYGLRTIDEMESVLAVLLAIGFAHILGTRNVSWAAFSAYMVMRSHLEISLRRGHLRIIGTAAGAAFACLLADQVAGSSLLLSAALALTGAITIYFALISDKGYAWLFTGLTFCMVAIDGMEYPHESVDLFAKARFLEVCVGALAAMAISILSAATIRHRLPAAAKLPPPSTPRKRLLWHKAAFFHAIQGAVALGLIPWIWQWFHIESLSQSSITIMTVMIVPLASVATMRPTTAKLIHRFVGCSVGGLLATGILLICSSSPVAMTLAVCAGVIVGRHIENGNMGIGYVGTQFTLAFLVVLVPDSYSNVDPGQGVSRMIGILFGMVLLEPVRLLFHRYLPLSEADS